MKHDRTLIKHDYQKYLLTSKNTVQNHKQNIVLAPSGSKKRNAGHHTANDGDPTKSKIIDKRTRQRSYKRINSD